jgi:hypothetical protein
LETAKERRFPHYAPHDDYDELWWQNRFAETATLSLCANMKIIRRKLIASFAPKVRTDASVYRLARIEILPWILGLYYGLPKRKVRWSYGRESQCAERLVELLLVRDWGWQVFWIVSKFSAKENVAKFLVQAGHHADGRIDSAEDDSEVIDHLFLYSNYTH